MNLKKVTFSMCNYSCNAVSNGSGGMIVLVFVLTMLAIGVAGHLYEAAFYKRTSNEAKTQEPIVAEKPKLRLIQGGNQDGIRSIYG